MRADQQHRAGDRPSAGRGAQHAGRGARRQRRHAEARRQSAQDVGLRRSHDPPRRPRPRRRPRRHPLVSSAANTVRALVRLTAGLAKLLAGLVLAVLVLLRRRLFPGARRPARLRRPPRRQGAEGVGRDRPRQARDPAHHRGIDRGRRFRPGLRACPGPLLADGDDAPARPGPALRDRAGGDRRQRHRRHRSHHARARALSRRLGQRRRALARHSQHARGLLRPA